jgi:hypothetical protein
MASAQAERASTGGSALLRVQERRRWRLAIPWVAAGNTMTQRRFLVLRKRKSTTESY